MCTITDDKIIAWLRTFLESQDINEPAVKRDTLSESRGFMARMIFLKVTGTKASNGEHEELNMVVKVSRSLKAIYDDARPFFKRELYVYKNLLPAFRNFELKKKVIDIFDNYPRCLQTLATKECDIVLLENLITQGYQSYNRMIPMSFQHITAVLKILAKFHAISFAFKDQKKDDFDKLTKDYTSKYKAVLESKFRYFYQLGTVRSYQLIKQIDIQLAERINKMIIDRGVDIFLSELYDWTFEESVITHGDCWNNNLMFRDTNVYEESPYKVMLFDWQLSSLHSPMMDVSYFLFLISSAEQVSKFDELLEYYHAELSKAIAGLGSDPVKLFPHSRMLEHWKLCSRFGFVYSLSCLYLIMSKAASENCLDMESIQSTEELKKLILALDVEDIGLLQKRIIATGQYYFNLVQ